MHDYTPCKISLDSMTKFIKLIANYYSTALISYVIIPQRDINQSDCSICMINKVISCPPSRYLISNCSLVDLHFSRCRFMCFVVWVMLSLEWQHKIVVTGSPVSVVNIIFINIYIFTLMVDISVFIT